MPSITRLPDYQEPTSKVCTMCGQEKPLDAFYIKDKHTGRRFSWCRDCHLWRTNEYHHRKSEPAREVKRNAPKPTEKRCTRCGEVKSLDSFHKAGNRHRSWCKACRAIEKAEYTERNRDRIRKGDAAYRRIEHTLITARYDLWRQEHPDRLREILNKSRTKRIDAHRAYNSRHQRENKERYNAYWHARRARKLLNGGSHTAEEWSECRAYFDYHCLMCGRREPEIKLTIDHIVPINLGGTDDIKNIQPLCQRCNSSKGDASIDFRPDWE
jgi:5-methylcytosine-specific restriction endonuclease McrA